MRIPAKEIPVRPENLLNLITRADKMCLKLDKTIIFRP